MLFSFFYFKRRVSVLILISVLQSFLGERYAKILTILPKILLELLPKLQQLPDSHFSILASLHIHKHLFLYWHFRSQWKLRLLPDMQAQKHSESFHSSTSDTGTATSELAEGWSGKRPGEQQSLLTGGRQQGTWAGQAPSGSGKPTQQMAKCRRGNEKNPSNSLVQYLLLSHAPLLF